MNPSKSRKLSVAILGLAVVAFLVDRLFLQEGPQAQPAAAAPASALPQVADGTAATAPAAPRPSLAARLATLAAEGRYDLAAVPEALAVPPSWLPPPAARPDTKPRLAGQEFARRHALTSVLMLDNEAAITVDERILRVGQQLDGFRLVHIEGHSAIFQDGSEMAELKLDPPTPQ